jgi:drug/metabolite transporter (DMT)-like permease
MSTIEAPAAEAASGITRRWHRLWPYLLLAIASLNFSLFFPVNRVATTSGVPFFAFVFWYALGAGLVLLVVAAAMGELPRLGRRYLRAYFLSSFLGFAAPFALLAFVASKLPSGVAVLLVILTPVFTYVFSLLVRSERLHWLSVGGLLAGVAGILLVVVPSGSLPSPDMAGWALIALLAPASFAALNVYTERYRPPEVPVFALSAAVLLAGALMLFPFVLATGQVYAFPGPLLDGDLAIAGAVIINILMWPLFYTVVRITGAFQFSIMNIVAVVLGFFWSIVFFAEQHSLYVWVAMILMLLGVGLIVLRPNTRRDLERRNA